MALADGLKLLFHFNNNWDDSSGNGVHGTPIGAALETTGPILGVASGHFDNLDDYVVTLDSPVFDFGAGDFTIMNWIRPDTLINANRTISAGSINDGAGNQWAFGVGDIWGGGTKINFARFNGVGYDDYLSSPVAMTLGVKHLIKCIRLGTNMEFYFNNSLISIVGIGAVQINGGNKGGIIGARYANATNNIVEFFGGLLDETAIWNRALSAGERTDLWNNGNGMEIGAEVFKSRRSRQMRATFFR